MRFVCSTRGFPVPAAAAALLLAAGGIAAQQLSLQAYCDRSEYAPRDTLVVILDVDIPRGWSLYGNPLGPGTGKPLRISAAWSADVDWVGLRKSAAERIESSDSEWVWGYRRDAQFFLTGVLRESAGGRTTCSLRITGLMCHGGCLAIDRSLDVAFTVRRGAAGQRFGAAPLARLRYARAERMEFAATPAPAVAFTPPGPAGAASGATRAQPRAAAGVTRPLAALDSTDLLPEQVFGWDYEPVEQTLRLNLLLAIVLGFVAGLLLNVMPCVLPVIGIKILSLAQTRGPGGPRPLLRGFAFGGGILAVFAILASFAAFANLSWGEQFRDPHMVSAIICVVVVFALGLFDFYAFSLPFGGRGAARSEGLADDFGRGMFATVMATPCSGPLLGAVLAWTLTQPIAVIYVVFAAIGAGMAAPYVALCASPRLMRLIPRPGRWMEDLKHVLAFALLGVAVYLMTGLRAAMIVCTVGMCLFITLALALYHRFGPLRASLRRRAWAGSAACLVVLLGVWVSFGVVYRLITPQGESAATRSGVEWRALSREALEEAHAAGCHVVVDFTASWCMNCQYNKAVVLNSSRVVALLQRKQVVAFKADLTGPNAVAESLLEHLGSRSVPFFAVFRGDDPYKPIVMRDVLSRPKVTRVLESLPDR